MSVDLLPFYGTACCAVGGLLMALASVMKLRKLREKGYYKFMLVGTLLVFFGFMLQAVYYLGEVCGYGKALCHIGQAVVFVCAVFGIWELLAKWGKLRIKSLRSIFNG